MKKIYLFLIAIIVISFTACQEEYVVGETATVKLAGEWWFALLDENGDVVYDYDFLASRMSTYNTADNSANEIWVDDHENGWWVKARVVADPVSMTFGSQDSVFNEYEGANMIVSDGQIWEGVATSKDGNITDSIRFTTVYPDGTIFIYAGHRHTGFEEDEYH